MYSRFGADVTVFQRGDTLLPDEDPDVSEVIETAFENEEITVQTGTPVTALTETNDGIRVDAGADGTVSVTASDVAPRSGPNTEYGRPPARRHRRVTGRERIRRDRRQLQNDC